MDTVMDAIEVKIDKVALKELEDTLIQQVLIMEELQHKELQFREELSVLDVINPFSKKEEKKEAKRLEKKIKKINKKYLSNIKRVGKLYVKTAFKIFPMKVKFSMFDLEKSIASLSATPTNAGLLASAHVNGLDQVRRDLSKLEQVLKKKYDPLFSECPESIAIYDYAIGEFIIKHDLPSIS